MQIGDKVIATNRRVTAELTVTHVFEAMPELQAEKPGIVCTIIAEGRVKRSDWCKIADVYSNGNLVWL